LVIFDKTQSDLQTAFFTTRLARITRTKYKTIYGKTPSHLLCVQKGDENYNLHIIVSSRA